MQTRGSNLQELKIKWHDYQEHNPKVRIRDAAKALEVSELELLATGIGESVTVLKPEWPAIISGVHKLGYVMALTRNEACVHERKGEYKNASAPSSRMGLVVGEDIDLRIFYSHWAYGLAVQEEQKRSLQFFDKFGVAVHKIHLNDKSNVSNFEQLVKAYQAEEAIEISIEKESPDKEEELLDNEIDTEGFLQDWAKLQDTHEFFGLLGKYKVTRSQSLRIAEGKFTQKASAQVVIKMLETASQANLEIMVFVNSPGMIQIHTGAVKNILIRGEWWNVMDPEFNLHLRSDLIDSVYIVKKPTKDGEVSSIEVLDKQGNMIVQFFGKRKPGKPENVEWKDLLEKLSI
ncbi:MAG: ChuX/HutX family heme-like substrate-binding protein [Spirochaetota bacterium]